MLVVQFLLQWGAGALYTGEWIPEEPYLDTPGDELFGGHQGGPAGNFVPNPSHPGRSGGGSSGKTCIAPIILGVCAARAKNGVILIAGIPMKYAAFNPGSFPSSIRG